MTEIVKFKVPDTVTEDQLFAKACILNDFQKNQDGFIDAELIKQTEAKEWCFIYHFESFEKAKSIGQKLRENKIFDEFLPVTEAGSVSVTFYDKKMNW